MSTTLSELSKETYKLAANTIFLQHYGIYNIRELIFTIYTLTKIDNKNREITIKFIKNRVSNKIYKIIRNEKCIYEIIRLLVVTDNENNRKRNQKLADYSYLKY